MEKYNHIEIVTIADGTVQMLNTNLIPFVITDYHGYVWPTWNKVPPIMYYLQIATPGNNCAGRQYSGIVTVTTANTRGASNTVTTQQLTFVNGISLMQSFDWKYGGVNSLSFTLTAAKQAVTYAPAQFTVIVPNTRIIYERELY